MTNDPLAPYQLPDTWTPDHVMNRLVWAFDAFWCLPGKSGPAGYGSCWPAYIHDTADINSQMSNIPGETDVERDERLAEYARWEDARRKIRPDAHQVDLMDEAFQWPLHHLGGESADGIQIVQWAAKTSRGYELDDILISKVYCEAANIAFSLLQKRVVVR